MNIGASVLLRCDDRLPQYITGDDQYRPKPRKPKNAPKVEGKQPKLPKRHKFENDNNTHMYIASGVDGRTFCLLPMALGSQRDKVMNKVESSGTGLAVSKDLPDDKIRNSWAVKLREITILQHHAEWDVEQIAHAVSRLLNHHITISDDKGSTVAPYPLHEALTMSSAY